MSTKNYQPINDSGKQAIEIKAIIPLTVYLDEKVVNVLVSVLHGHVQRSVALR
jgi:hypothetical protein